MSSRSLLFAAAFLLLAAGGLATAFLRWQVGPAAPPPLESLPPEPPRPVPGEMAAEFQEIENLRRNGSFAEAARRYPVFLERLAGVWGAGSRDLALYHYDHARSLVLAHRPEEGLEVAARAEEAWPDCLPLQLLEARTRLGAAVPRGRYDPRADRVSRRLLERSNHPRLRGLAVDPAALASQWAEMLFQVGQYKEALEAAEVGLSADPKSIECRAAKAQVLLELERPQEALALFRELVTERDTAVFEIHLGIAHLKCGDPAAAWERFSRLLKKEATRDEPRTLPDALFADLQLQAGRALNQLHRPREAAELLLERLILEPENDRALHQLAASVRALGAAPGAAGLDLRLRQLLAREALRESALRAQHRGEEPLAAMELAQAALAVDRSGEALGLLNEARRTSPQVPKLHLEAARVLSLVGRDELAEAALREGFQACGSPALLLELARLLASRGEAAEARRILGDPRTGAGAGQERPEARPADAGRLASRRARSLLELGEVPAARALLDARPPSVERDEEGLLCLAETAVLERQPELARKLLAESYPNLPGGAAWAGALRAFEEMSEGKTVPGALEERSASDLLDHPRLLLNPALSGPWAARLREGLQRRREISSRIARAGEGNAALSAWKELWDLYRELEAARKAREAAWYLVSIAPKEVDAHRLLALALSAPEEVVARMSALQSALRLAPGDRELESMLAAARGSLGLEAR